MRDRTGFHLIRSVHQTLQLSGQKLLVGVCQGLHPKTLVDVLHHLGVWQAGQEGLQERHSLTLQAHVKELKREA